MSARAIRFRDPTSPNSLYVLATYPIDVVCPRCSAHARVLVDLGDGRRLMCSGCGHTRTWTPGSGSSWWGAAFDPFFQQPLWLTATVRGHRLWAYNRESAAGRAGAAARGMVILFATAQDAVSVASGLDRGRAA